MGGEEDGTGIAFHQDRRPRKRHRGSALEFCLDAVRDSSPAALIPRHRLRRIVPVAEGLGGDLWSGRCAAAGPGRALRIEISSGGHTRP